MSTTPTAERTRRILAEIPRGVTVVAAAKMRTTDEIRAALAGGIAVVGENYVQEANAVQTALGRNATQWHMIGRLQRNKAKDAVRLFDLIQTVDSLALGEALDSAARAVGLVMPVLVEVNSAREPQKAGALPEGVDELVRALDNLESLRVVGLMTMGPITSDPETLRPLFRETRGLFDALAGEEYARARMEILSMGMSNSYRVAIEERATMVRIGSALFGTREIPGA